MSKLRVLSGREVLKILGEFGFEDYTQRGSHIKLRRGVSGGRTQTITVPNHSEIDRGTLHAPRHLPAGISVHTGVRTSQVFHTIGVWPSPDHPPFPLALSSSITMHRRLALLALVAPLLWAQTFTPADYGGLRLARRSGVGERAEVRIGPEILRSPRPSCPGVFQWRRRFAHGKGDPAAWGGEAKCAAL